MKIILALPVTVMLLLSCSSDDNDVPEQDKTAIASPSFEQALIDLGIDEDGTVNGVIRANNVAAITYLPLNDANITSITNLEAFTGLKKLEVFNNQLTALDVSKNKALKEINCANNLISDLDVSQNTQLTSLICFDNQLARLDVSRNLALATLACTNNKLTSLDVSKNINLSQLYCSQNDLTSLDLGANSALEELFCFENRIASLDLGNNGALKELYCNDNLLALLNVKNGNNSLLLEFNAMGNLGLSCIQIDDEIKANLGQSIYGQWFTDPNVTYAEDCETP